MEPESPSVYPQVPATCPSPEPIPSSPHDPLQLPQDPSQYYPPIYVLVSPMASFPTNTLCTPLSSPIRATCPAHLICLHFTTRAILGKEYRSFSSSLCSFLHSRHLVPLRPKYSPQHPILKHPQPAFLPQCQRPGFTPIQNHYI